MTVKSFMQYLQGLKALCYTFITASAVFCGIVISITPGPGNAAANPQQILLLNYVVPGFAAVCIITGTLIFNRRLAAIKERPTLTDKLGGYKMATIVRYILMDAPALIASMSYFLSGEKELLIVTGTIILIMVLLVPGKARVMQQLSFTQEQINFING